MIKNLVLTCWYGGPRKGIVRPWSLVQFPPALVLCPVCEDFPIAAVTLNASPGGEWVRAPLQAQSAGSHHAAGAPVSVDRLDAPERRVAASSAGGRRRATRRTAADRPGGSPDRVPEPEHRRTGRWSPEESSSERVSSRNNTAVRNLNSQKLTKIKLSAGEVLKLIFNFSLCL